MQFMYNYILIHKINVPCFNFSKITAYVVIFSHKLGPIDVKAKQDDLS